VRLIYFVCLLSRHGEKKKGGEGPYDSVRGMQGAGKGKKKGKGGTAKYSLSCALSRRLPPGKRGARVALHRNCGKAKREERKRGCALAVLDFRKERKRKTPVSQPGTPC